MKFASWAESAREMVLLTEDADGEGLQWEGEVVGGWEGGRVEEEEEVRKWKSGVR